MKAARRDWSSRLISHDRFHRSSSSVNRGSRENGYKTDDDRVGPFPVHEVPCRLGLKAKNLCRLTNRALSATRTAHDPPSRPVRLDQSAALSYSYLRARKPLRLRNPSGPSSGPRRGRIKRCTCLDSCFQWEVGIFLARRVVHLGADISDSRFYVIGLS